jgi:prepilin-type N-terminal cleavage/methylation domain-containing protein
MKNKGLTLMELTIVLAILAIIAAILIPLFLLTTDRARLRADIQSAQVIQNARELYRIERGTQVTGDNVNDIVKNLADADYLNSRNVTIQTEGAAWVICTADRIIKVNINDSPADVHKAYNSLSEDEQTYVLGVRQAN